MIMGPTHCGVHSYVSLRDSVCLVSVLVALPLNYDFMREYWPDSDLALIDSIFVKLKCRVNPSSTVALHTRPIERTQSRFAAHALNLLFHTTILYCFHPLHRLHKYGWTFRKLFIIFPRITTSLSPFKAFLTLTALMGNYMLLWSNNSSTFLAAIYYLRFWFRSQIRIIRCCHLRLATQCLGRERVIVSNWTG